MQSFYNGLNGMANFSMLLTQVDLFPKVKIYLKRKSEICTKWKNDFDTKINAR